MISYVSNVNSMSCYPQAEGESDVVFSVLWTMSATDGTYHASASRSCDVTYEAGTPYTPYDQLTQEQVIGWVYSATPEKDIEEMQASLAEQINAQAQPTVVSPPLPWN